MDNNDSEKDSAAPERLNDTGISQPELQDNPVAEEPSWKTNGGDTEPASNEEPVDPRITNKSEDQSNGPQPWTPVAAAPIVAPAEKPKRRLHLPAPEKILPGFLRRKLGKYARFASILLILVILGGVASAAVLYTQKDEPKPVEHFSAVTVPFKVLSTTPEKDQKDVTQANKIVILFNRPVNPEKLNGDFFTSPEVTGTYATGADDKEVIFTPDVPFAEGTVVKAMIHGEFQSKDGTALGADYIFGFTTATPGNAVVFQRLGLIETVGSAPTGSEQSYTLSVGESVDAKGEINVYKADVSSLLDALVYGDKKEGDYSYSDYLNKNVDVSGMKSVKSQQGLKEGDILKFTPEKGVYAVVASAGGKQVGSSWLVVSDLGVILRQDDQKIVLTAQDYKTNKAAAADVTLYNMKDAKNQIRQLRVDGETSADVPYSSKVDLVVATEGDNVSVVPVSSPLSLADLRVQQDLSLAKKSYVVTDKPTYGIGQKVQYGGFVRSDNDAQYSPLVSGTVSLYVSDSPGGDHLADLTPSVSDDGQVSGSFTADSKFLDKSQASRQLQIYAVSGGENNYLDPAVGAFTVTNGKSSAYLMSVGFDKTSYLASDQVTATVIVKTTDGKPVGNTSVNVDVYAKDYYENDTNANQESFGILGAKITEKPMVVNLDANGQGTLNVDTTKLPAGSSQALTVQASKADPKGVVASAGAGTVVHQGNGTLEFAPAKTVIAPGGNAVARIYAKTLDGKPLANAKITYILENDQKLITSGEVKADGNGFAEINQSVGSAADQATVTLTVTTADSYNNLIQAETYYYVYDSSESGFFSELQLAGVDVTNIPQDITVGQKLNLTITAPKDMHALISLERGRIHKFETVDLKAGKNNYSVDVTAEFAPSFTMVISYFDGGQYRVDGVDIDVSPKDKQAVLKVTSNKQVYKAGDTATFNISALSSGKPLATDLVVGVVDANIYNLYDTSAPDMFSFMYAPREITTNSSSSLTSIGSGGGKCGGGFGDVSSLTGALGTTLLWQPDISTAANGSAAVQVKLPKGSWKAYVYSMSSDTIVGEASATVSAN